MEGKKFNQWDWNLLWASKTEMDAVVDAIADGDLPALKELLSANPKIWRWEWGGGKTLLELLNHVAEPSEAILDYLLSHDHLTIEGEIGTERWRYGSSPLWKLCQENGSLNTARLLIDRGANVDVRAGDGPYPLTYAVMHNRLDLLELLLDHGADPSFQDGEKNTPLKFAKKLGLRAISERLSESEAPLDGRPCSGIVGKVRAESTIDLEPLREELSTFIRAAVRKAAADRREVHAIGVTSAARKGFVSIGFSYDPIDPYRPDCFEDIPNQFQLRQAPWEKAFSTTDRITVRYAGKEKSFTIWSYAQTHEKPIFDVVNAEFKQAMTEGVFDPLDLSGSIIYGCQSHYFHQCVCYNSRRKKIPVPVVRSPQLGLSGIAKP